jgi:hypothetical protein
LEAIIDELAFLEDSSGDEDLSDAGNLPKYDDDQNKNDKRKNKNSDGQHPVIGSTKEPPVFSVPPSATNKTPSPAVIDNWNSQTYAVLKEECRRHGLAVSRTKTTLVARTIIAYKKRTMAQDQDAVLLHRLSTEELLALQSLEELIKEVSCRKDDLVEFRSHLARHKSEEEYATNELEDLLDDEAIVTADFQMKILSCFLVWKTRNIDVRVYDYNKPEGS